MLDSNSYALPEEMIGFVCKTGDGRIVTPALVEKSRLPVFKLYIDLLGNCTEAEMREAMRGTTASDRLHRLAAIVEARHGKPEQS